MLPPILPLLQNLCSCCRKLDHEDSLSRLAHSGLAQIDTPAIPPCQPRDRLDVVALRSSSPHTNRGMHQLSIFFRALPQQDDPHRLTLPHPPTRPLPFGPTRSFSPRTSSDWAKSSHKYGLACPRSQGVCECVQRVSHPSEDWAAMVAWMGFSLGGTKGSAGEAMLSSGRWDAEGRGVGGDRGRDARVRGRGRAGYFGQGEKEKKRREPRDEFGDRVVGLSVGVWGGRDARREGARAHPVELTPR